MTSIGFDLHPATTVVAVLDADGKVAMETIVATEAAAIIRFLKSLSGTLHITFEETTQAWFGSKPSIAHTESEHVWGLSAETGGAMVAAAHRAWNSTACERVV